MGKKTQLLSTHDVSLKTSNNDSTTNTIPLELERECSNIDMNLSKLNISTKLPSESVVTASLSLPETPKWFRQRKYMHYKVIEFDTEAQHYLSNVPSVFFIVL